MKKIYYMIICMLVLVFCVACHEKTGYTRLFRYNGEYYHYGRGRTLIVPEKEVGEIQSITGVEGVLPKEDYQVNAEDDDIWVGTKLYMTSGDDYIYIMDDEKLESGEIVYECYEKGALKTSDLETDLYCAYVTYNGHRWLLEDEKKKIPEDYKKEIRIHSYGQCYMSVDHTTNQEELLGGSIYISEDNEEVIYAKALNGRIWKAVPDDN